jgi:hypothetical protein
MNTNREIKHIELINKLLRYVHRAMDAADEVEQCQYKEEGRACALCSARLDDQLHYIKNGLETLKMLSSSNNYEVTK